MHAPAPTSAACLPACTCGIIARDADACRWNVPAPVITIGFALYNLYRLLGAAGLIAASAMLVFVPMAALLTRYVTKLSRGIQSIRDERGRLIDEAVTGIVTLKVYGWLDWFRSKITAVRDTETDAIRRKQVMGVMSDFCGFSIPLAIMAGMFALNAWLNPNTPLTAATAFSAISWVRCRDACSAACARQPDDGDA